jgi:hypothetical protein
MYSTGVIPNGKHLEKKESNGILRCSGFCHKNDACMSFSYNAGSKECVLSNIDFFREDVSITKVVGVEIYSMFFL